MPAGKTNLSGASSAPTERSDDDSAAPGPSSSGQSKSQRSAKACDRCRKSKSKCEPAPVEGKPCKSCAAIGAAPSFRRGPPKGYIQALEHRLHQVESVLAAIMSSTDIRSRSVIDELSKDELASHILDTVDAGPFGRTGRQKRSIDPTKDNFFSSIIAERPRAQSHRSRRESRATREHVIENVISRDPDIQTTRPTLAWQDRLSERLARSFGGRSISPHSARSSVPLESSKDASATETSEPPRAKRRLDGPSTDSVQLLPPYTSHHTAPQAAEDDLEDCADAFGNLSIDENREVRYHGNSSGLQLLVQAERTDGRNIKGIWNFPMARFWPGPSLGPLLVEESDQSRRLEIRLPPERVQRLLLDVYFKYVNPAVPVVDEESFMTQYESICSTSDRSPYPTPPMDMEVRPEHPQKLSDLLLFSMFAYAACYLDPLRGSSAAGPGQTQQGTYKGASGSRSLGGERQDAEDRWVSATEYAVCARRILDTMYHESRSSTVQALVLLGMREFGIGSLEEGWLHIGMAIRMALDLGMNRDPDKWTHDGRELFTEKEKEIRKRIWWSCCIADKFSALSLGRTILVHEGDMSTPLPEIPPNDREKMWQPSTVDPRYGTIAPVSGAYAAYLRHISSLYIITGEILAKVYRVSRERITPPRELRQKLYHRLLQWAFELPEHLDYSVKSSRPCPAPHVLAMHVQYWASVLLLHRPFIPKGADLARFNSPSLDPDPAPWESYDICQSAASQVASFAMLYHETYDLRWGPPFMANCIQAAGLATHFFAVKYKPLDTQASVGLQKCINALVGMEATWTTALRVRHLIQHAEVNIDRASASAVNADARPKRSAHDAFEHQAIYDVQARPAEGSANMPSPTYGAPQPPAQPPAGPSHSAYAHVVPSQPPHVDHTLSQRRVHTQAYGHRPPVYPSQDALPRDDQPFPGYVPGYVSWWPVLEQQDNIRTPATPVHPGHVGVPFQGVQTPTHGTPPGGPGMTADPGPDGAGVPSALPNQNFTFSQEHFSPQFLQAMRDPMLHFPSAFAHQY
ncbi:fungal-specific transcription factor domain-containing protein [Trametes punicea]|nr:fungal-specific transcription factor domain-containing protein [Trametes punicea]